MGFTYNSKILEEGVLITDITRSFLKDLKSMSHLVTVKTESRNIVSGKKTESEIDISIYSLDADEYLLTLGKVYTTGDGAVWHANIINISKKNLLTYLKRKLEENDERVNQMA